MFFDCVEDVSQLCDAMNLTECENDESPPDFDFQFPQYDSSNTQQEEFVYFNQKKSEHTRATEDFNQFLEASVKLILEMKLKRTDTDKLFQLIVGLLKNVKSVFQNWTNEFVDPLDAIDLITQIACNHFQTFASAYKRNQELISNNRFVAPVEIAIGTRWEMKKIDNTHGRAVRIPKHIQSTLQYVPILKSLESLFSCEEFSSLYFQYNQNQRTNEIGKDGSKLYSGFSSGSAYAQNDLFKNHPDSLQLQIAVDDFEPCNPLQSKANRHKICAVYFRIHNLPPKHQSKLHNIHLVCLCNSDDLKTKQTDFNNIWQLIVDEISILEKAGIDVVGRNIKGTLVHTAFDNLGANQSLGFSGK